MNHVHGIFDVGELAGDTGWYPWLARRVVALEYRTDDKVTGSLSRCSMINLSDGVRKSMDMEAVYAMLREAAI